MGSAIVAFAGVGLLRNALPAWPQGVRPPAGRESGISVPESAIPFGNLTYGVERDGSKIGRHVMEISGTNDVVTVLSETNIAVRILLITAYRFEQRAREVWRGGRLIEFSATTNDDGSRNQVDARARDDALVLTVGGRTATMPATVMPASLWNPHLIKQSKLFDTADGRPLNINVQFAGEESLTVRGSNVTARRFSFTGDVTREIWYYPTWTPVQAHLLRSKDKSIVKFVLT